jgi:hypothetical protein
MPLDFNIECHQSQLGAPMGSKSFVESFVVKVLHKDLGPIFNLRYLIFRELLACSRWAMPETFNYLLCTMFPFPAILQHYVKFNPHTIATLEKLLGVRFLMVLLVTEFVVRVFSLLYQVSLASLLKFKLLPPHSWDVGH